MMSEAVRNLLLEGHSPIDQDYIKNMLYVNEDLYHHFVYPIVGNGWGYIIQEGQIRVCQRWW